MAFNKFIKINKIGSSELQGVLDKGFLKIFTPFRFVQRILGSCRVDVTGRIVAAPTLVQKCYTIICLILSFFYSAKYVKFYSESYSDPGIAYLFISGISALNLTFNLSIFHTTFINNEGNVKLYIIMQKIDNVLNLQTKDYIHNDHYRHNLMVVLGLVTIYSIHAVLFILLTENQYGVLVQFGSFWTFYSFVFELSNCCSHVLFFTYRVRAVNDMIINHLKNKMDDIKTLSKRCTSTELDDFESSDTYNYMKEILNGFSCFRGQYKFQVFLFCTVFISWLTVGFQYAILSVQRTESIKQRILLLDYIYLGTMACTNINMLLWICLRIELFLREVRKTKRLAIIVLSRYIDGPLRQKAKKMFKLIDETPPCFSVYGMWRMDARVSLSMIQIVTSTYVILLQFAFL